MGQTKEELLQKRRERYAALPDKEKERRRAISRKYGKKHRKQLNEWAKQYRKENPEWARETNKRSRQKQKKLHPEKTIWSELRKRARQRGILFNLNIEDIVIPEVCPILGIKLEFGIGRVHDASPSVDRIVPSKGYTKGNCFIISSKANRMKQENTLEDFEKIMNYIKERIK